ncbi:MAG TPA: aspartate aminotransferase family protein [Archaeoglobus profundus]|nr:aspartate aminotransferase family protein [Archaeoglobus profundus]HIP57910.1 aspartate aminotransferase family protein [Archaeoglobus profundus]
MNWNWFDREAKVMIPFFKRQRVVFVRGEGCWLYDINGKKYLDMVAGIATVSIGHSHPYFIKRVYEQLNKLVHVSNLFYTIPQIELGEKLQSITGLDKFFFCNSGTEAVEASLKIARKYTGRKKFVAFINAFHGRTMGALSVTWKEKFRKPFEPLIKPVEFAKFNDITDLEKKVDDDTAAVILEPIQGEAGVYPADNDFIKAIFEERDEHGFVIIFDEIQTGFGRTGEWFAKDHFKVDPDIITMAKAMGSGIPIGGVGVKDEIAEKMEHTEHASTFGGNPLACVASLATIEIIEKEKLVENSKKMGEYLKRRLNEIGLETRGLGLMIGVDIDNAFEVVRRALEKGLVINATSERTLRLVPPLIIKRDEIDYAIEILNDII